MQKTLCTKIRPFKIQNRKSIFSGKGQNPLPTPHTSILAPSALELGVPRVIFRKRSLLLSALVCVVGKGTSSSIHRCELKSRVVDGVGLWLTQPISYYHFLRTSTSVHPILCSRDRHICAIGRSRPRYIFRVFKPSTDGSGVWNRSRQTFSELACKIDIFRKPKTL